MKALSPLCSIMLLTHPPELAHLPKGQTPSSEYFICAKNKIMGFPGLPFCLQSAHLPFRKTRNLTQTQPSRICFLSNKNFSRQSFGLDSAATMSAKIPIALIKLVFSSPYSSQTNLA